MGRRNAHAIFESPPFWQKEKVRSSTYQQNVEIFVCVRALNILRELFNSHYLHPALLIFQSRVLISFLPEHEQPADAFFTSNVFHPITLCIWPLMLIQLFRAESDIGIVQIFIEGASSRSNTAQSAKNC